MKRMWITTVLALVFLSGCDRGHSAMDRAMTLRQQVQSRSCAFVATVTADYGDAVQEFVLRCESEPADRLRFEVLAPEQISGITGWVDSQGGKLTFDDQVLAFAPLAEGQLAPVTAPWLLLQTLQSGYLADCGEFANGLRISLDDTYQADAFRVEVRTGEADLPVSAEIFWQGRRVLTLRLENFRFL